MRRTRAGFTLVELLAVLAILALVMSLTAGAVQRVRQAGVRAERAAWQQNRRNGNTIPRSTPVRVLFVGNSYTSVNDLPGAVKALADADRARGGPGLVVGSHTVGGAKLRDHWEAGTAPDLVRSGDWDLVVLQEQSQTPLPGFGRDRLYVPYGRKFCALAREANAVPVLYLTWPRPDTPGFVQLDYTLSVADLARDAGAEVAAAGIAKEIVEGQIPGFPFTADAGGHPTAAGTYVAACAFFAAVFDTSPEGLPASVTTASGAAVGVPAVQAPVVQRAAAEAHARAKKLLDRDPERRHLR
ncbi:MAG: hypothetical protein C0501_29880 [Isosphaera sp.]|nr:hypothetical protein [Isosphaera sp.]